MWYVAKGEKTVEGEGGRKREKKKRKKRRKRKTRARNESRGLVPLDLYLRRRIEINEMSCFLLLVYLCIMHLCSLRSRMRAKHLIFVGISGAMRPRGGRDWIWTRSYSRKRIALSHRRIFTVSWHAPNFRAMEKEEEWKRLVDALIIPPMVGSVIWNVVLYIIYASWKMFLDHFFFYFLPFLEKKTFWWNAQVNNRIYVYN